VTKLRAKKERQRRLLTEDFNADAAKYFYNAPLPEGHTLRPLVESDARYVLADDLPGDEHVDDEVVVSSLVIISHRFRFFHCF
jgi:hypothetical protein